MAVHELKTEPRWLARVVAGEKRAEVRKHDRDFQVGDTLALIETDRWGNPAKDWVERDERGRFLNEYVQRPPVIVYVTHVLDGRHADGIADDYCLLSFEIGGEA